MAKSIHWMVAALALMASSFANADGPATGTVGPGDPKKPQLVIVTPTKVFTPYGFDDNDNAQVVVQGNFPNTCYKVGPVETAINPRTHEVRLTSYAYFYDGCWCLDVLVHFTQVVNLGVLDKGQYKVEIQSKDGASHELATLPIAAARSPGPDDHLYAPVREASLESPASDGSRILVLRGNFPNTCMKYQETKIFYRAPNTIEVLPLSVMSGQDCRDVSSPFEIKVALKPTQTGETLIHIRSLNGQSVNLTTEF
jgi:hypothetical protein